MSNNGYLLANATPLPRRLRSNRCVGEGRSAQDDRGGGAPGGDVCHPQEVMFATVIRARLDLPSE